MVHALTTVVLKIGRIIAFRSLVLTYIVIEEILGRVLETKREIEKTEIEVIPIQRLVRIQLGSGLMIADYLSINS